MKNDHALTTKEFLNPNSMLTPGFAGGMTMMITNTIAGQFDLGYPWSAVVGLLISLLFGLLAVTATAIPSWQKLIYYVLNSLIMGYVRGICKNRSQVVSNLKAIGYNGDLSYHLRL